MSNGSENRLYLPGLNGIRTVAALTVLFAHMFAPFGDWGLDPLPYRIPWPEEPVTTFFVISGFLITYLMMNEIGKKEAALSYKYIESPFLKMKDRFTVVKSTNETE